jgi:hypothetical protein
MASLLVVMLTATIAGGQTYPRGLAVKSRKVEDGQTIRVKVEGTNQGTFGGVMFDYSFVAENYTPGNDVELIHKEDNPGELNLVFGMIVHAAGQHARIRSSRAIVGTESRDPNLPDPSFVYAENPAADAVAVWNTSQENSGLNVSVQELDSEGNPIDSPVTLAPGQWLIISRDRARMAPTERKPVIVKEDEIPFAGEVKKWLEANRPANRGR